jgi:hypothetical protein
VTGDVDATVAPSTMASIVRSCATPPPSRSVIPGKTKRLSSTVPVVDPHAIREMIVDCDEVTARRNARRVFDRDARVVCRETVVRERNRRSRDRDRIVARDEIDVGGYLRARVPHLLVW